MLAHHARMGQQAARTSCGERKKINLPAKRVQRVAGLNLNKPCVGGGGMTHLNRGAAGGKVILG